jgi:hypothetical protein
MGLLLSTVNRSVPAPAAVGSHCHAGAMEDVLASMVGPVQSLVPVARGYTHSKRVVATLRDGRSVFAKQAVDEMTATWLRQEYEMYEALSHRSFVPDVLGWADDDRPVLVLEDLSDAFWPPPWDRDRIDIVLATLDEIARCPAPTGRPLLTDGEPSDDGWHLVLADPSAFLSLGLCPERWLDEAGPVLRDAAGGAPRAGRHLLHCDVRSDNICFRRGSALFVDWNFASVGNPQYDVACWLPSLAAENGPRPEDVCTTCPPELAAWVSGFFASRAGEPDLPHAPLVRQIQRRQLVTALPWAARVLGLPPP